MQYVIVEIGRDMPPGDATFGCEGRFDPSTMSDAGGWHTDWDIALVFEHNTSAGVVSLVVVTLDIDFSRLPRTEIHEMKERLTPNPIDPAKWAAGAKL